MASSEAAPGPMLRIIDANLNRIGEGLRLLEDVARLALNDADLTAQLKAMRHQIVEGDLSFNQQLLQSRDAEADVGARPDHTRRRELPLVVVSNSRRVQEALRVIEELAKVPQAPPALNPDRLKQARFSLYSIERALLSRLLRQDKARSIAGVYFILEAEGAGAAEMANQAIRGGAGVIHLVCQGLSKRDAFSHARQLRNICVEHGVLFIIDGEVDLALATGADGVHLGAGSLPISAARKLLPLDKVVGLTIKSVEQATASRAEGADYLIIETVEDSGEELALIKEPAGLPLVAAGNYAGADAVAVRSSELSGDIETAVRQLAAQFKKGE